MGGLTFPEFKSHIRNWEAEKLHQQSLSDSEFAAILFLPHSSRARSFLEVHHPDFGNFDEEASLTDECTTWCRENLASYWDLTWNARMRFMCADDAVLFMIYWW